MTKQDTIKLLRECDSGVTMGVSAIDEVLDYVSSDKLKALLQDSKREHQRLDERIKERLFSYEEEGKEPNIMAKSMSWMKTNIKLTVNESDNTIADLIMDGCNMGVKALNRYLNKYSAADDQAKDIACELSRMEEVLARKLREFL